MICPTVLSRVFSVIYADEKLSDIPVEESTESVLIAESSRMCEREMSKGVYNTCGKDIEESTGNRLTV